MASLGGQRSVPQYFAAILLGMLFCVRYLGFGSVPFNGDEASLQLAARHALETGEIPWLGLAGTAGTRYGPTGIWFYTVLRWISPRLEFAFFVHATLHGLGFLLQGIAFQRVLQKKFLIPFLVFAWSAPLFWISARNVWDNSIQIFLFGVIGVLLFPEDKRTSDLRPDLSVPRALLSGLVAGLLVNLHLMTVPIVGAWIFWAWTQGRLRSRGLVIVGAACLLIALPYFYAAAGAPRPPTADPKPWIHFFHRAVIFPFLLPGLVLPGRAAYFFDQPWESWAGPLARAWSDLGLSGVLQLLGAGLGVLGLSKLPRRARYFVLLHGAIYGAFVAALRLNIQIHPHYLNPVFGIAVLLWTLGWIELLQVRKKIAFFVLLGIAVLNVSAILKIESVVRSEHGFRGAHWGASLGELGRVSSEYCANPELKQRYSPWSFALDARLGFDPSLALEFLISETPGCVSPGALSSLAPLPVGLRSPESSFSAALSLPSESISR
jgi:hypothetical protein